jgi:hypothetical protein
MVDCELVVDQVDIAVRQFRAVVSKKLGERHPLAVHLPCLELPEGNLAVPRIPLDSELEVGIPHAGSQESARFFGPDMPVIIDMFNGLPGTVEHFGYSAPSQRADRAPSPILGRKPAPQPLILGLGERRDDIARTANGASTEVPAVFFDFKNMNRC